MAKHVKKHNRVTGHGSVPGRSRQHEMGGGKFKSERQRRFMWAAVPRAARKWAHNLDTNKSDWAGAHRPSAKRQLKRRRK